MTEPWFNAICELSLIGRDAKNPKARQLISLIDHLISERFCNVQLSARYIVTLQSSEFVDTLASWVMGRWREPGNWTDHQDKAIALFKDAFEATVNRGNFFGVMSEEAQVNIL
jgi:hypothetical protein